MLRGKLSSVTVWLTWQLQLFASDCGAEELWQAMQLRVSFLLFQFLQFCFHCRRELREQERELQSHSPGRTVDRMHGISVELCRHVDGLQPKLEDPSNAPANRHRPNIPAHSFPVCGDDW